ncbi:MAG: histidine kinase dimerization/phospho-acceptor domain-containing protein [Lachnospiraceae bacterium]|nr:histidine kinase dimerization/phospho-acceptor domain-containing protein [Lachnospiraceae bacterium]
MKYSIKKQFAMIFVLLMAGTILLCWFINTTFLGRFYIEKRRQVLLHAYDTINAAASDGSIISERFDIELQKICGKYNINMVVIDADSETIKSSNNNPEMMTKQLLSKFFGKKNRTQSILTEKENYMIEITTDHITQTEYMEMWGILDNGNLFLFRIPVEGIRDSASIANQFLAYGGIFAALIGAIVIIYVSNKVTEPILQLTEISKKMTNLDFEAKYHGEVKNEVGLLGEHMNQMAETLEKTISQLKTANIELQNDIAQKDRVDAMRREFIANVSHELKTPIALIQGYAEGLQEGISDDPESKAFYCEVIIDEANKMNNMVKKIMTLSSLESGNDTVTMERFCITDLIRNTIQSVSILTKQNGIQIKFSQSADSVYAWADEFKIEEVFRNYLSNAINHCSGDKIIQVKLVTHDTKVRVSVFNTGEPIQVTSIEHLWEKFYKVDKARTREYGGSGVGLSIVKAIMESMNQGYGVINYENGVEFWFELDTK